MFTARAYDSEVGLYYYRARYYKPSIGRFLQTDPVGYSASGLNLYSYCGNNPLNFNDPSGLCKEFLTGLVQGVMTALIIMAAIGLLVSLLPFTLPAWLAAALIGIGVFGAGWQVGQGIIGQDVFGNQLSWYQSGNSIGQGFTFAGGGFYGAAHLPFGAQGTASSGEVPVGTKVTRNWGGESGPWGESWTTDPVTIQSRNSLGLETTNTTEFVTHGTVIDNTGITTSTASRWGRFAGGGQETIVPSSINRIRPDAVTMPDAPLPWSLPTDPLPLPTGGQ